MAEYRPPADLPIIWIASVDQVRNSHCVYVHSIVVHGELPKVIYVGVCKVTDAFETKDAYRNSLWRTMVKDDTLLMTEIRLISDSITTCNNEARRIYDQQRPICNVKGHLNNGRAIVTCIEGPNAGKTYNTVTEAAQCNGIAQPALSNHLNGRPGYGSIRGMKFRKGMGT